jgi:hypothetical protein
MARRIRFALPAVLAVGALAMPAVAGGASTKTCTEEGSPHKNFTTTFTQTSACTSNSEVNKSPETATNNGGNAPAGQQP